MSNEDPNQLPKETFGDHVHTVARMVLGAFPVVGSSVVELLNKLLPSPIERRRNEYVQSLGEGLEKLVAMEAVSIEELQKDEAFVTAVMQTSAAAIRNHQKEKLDALRNAALNAALPNALDDSYQQIFINIVDVSTEWHIRILNLLQDPRRWYRDNNNRLPEIHSRCSLTTVFIHAYPELRNRKDFYELVLSDLEKQGLVINGTSHLEVIDDKAFEKRTTALGDRFLAFITEPEQLKNAD